ncbi:chemotaxis protein CheA [Halovenus sp. WSH3]|uniref:Chemotaxis protein CheA n=1 Tax=Halovenus carboxidivorans TaxID=2692199 RepID=A0A6B0T6Z1_9EURY|nr:chemotaxis protein CheC [Halovenus carboxidivorans]MXR52717.1 chemotaxis protein CheA [Halovenus carboxidivorans]
MKIDVQSLDTFNRLAHEGAQEATASMAQMTGIDATVDVTKISLIDRADIGEELGAGSFVGVEFGFEGALSGDTVLVFERGQTEEIVESMMPGASTDDSMGQSAVQEVGNIMMSGFIDGWAEHLGASIEHTPPGYIEGEGAEILPDGPETGEHDQLFVFRSEIGWEGESVNFFIYMLPEYEPMAELMAEYAETDADAIPIEKLAVFNQMTQQGTERAAENVQQMSGIETEAEVSQISFVPIEDVPRQFGEETFVGTAVEFTGAPSGFLLVLFDEQSAITVAEGLMPVEMDSDELTEQHKMAIEELGNIMTSGFVDGWANVLQQSVDHTPPRLVHDMGRAIIDPLAAQLGQHQQHAFVIDSKMKTDEVEFESEIHALPNEQELREALDELDVERADKTDADAGQIF